MSLPNSARIGQVALLVLTVGLIAYIFHAPAPGVGDTLRPVNGRVPMPDFTMPDLQGGQWKLSAHRGRVVLVNFWGTWCDPCREEIPSLIRLAKSEPALDIAGIPVRDSETAVRKFVLEAGVVYPILLPPNSFPLADDLEGVPTTFLVDRQGKVAREYVGAVSEKMMRDDIDRVLAER